MMDDGKYWEWVVGENGSLDHLVTVSKTFRNTVFSAYKQLPFFVSVLNLI